MKSLEKCPWSPGGYCDNKLFSDLNNAFIIGSNAPDRKEYIDLIKEVLREFKLEPDFALDIKRYNGKAEFCANICGPIRKSRIIIADLSGTFLKSCTTCNHREEFSVNVFWEYGYAAALEKDPILICDENQDLPFDVGSKNADFYNLRNIKDVIRPLIRDKLAQPIPIKNHQILTRLISKEYQETISNKMNILKEKINNNDLKLCFNIFPSEPIENLFPLDGHMKDFLEKKSPLRIKKDDSIFRDVLNFQITQDSFYYISDYPWMGNNIQLSEDGIVNYIIYVNGKENLIQGTQNYKPVYYKVFPKYEILDCYLGFLDYIKTLFNYASYNDLITITLEIENINNYHLFGEYGYEPSMNPNRTKFKLSQFNKIQKVYHINTLGENDVKIKVAKDFFDPILRAYNRVDLPIYDSFMEYFNSHL